MEDIGEERAKARRSGTTLLSRQKTTAAIAPHVSCRGYDGRTADLRCRREANPGPDLKRAICRKHTAESHVTSMAEQIAALAVRVKDRQ